MADCSTLLTSLDPCCEAKKKKGGVKKKVWIGFFDVMTFTEDVDGYVDAVTLTSASPANVLYTFEGKKLKNNGTFEGQVGENTNTINQNLNLVLFYFTPDERGAINDLFTAEDVVVFVETEGGQIEIWGYDTALNASALTGGTGAALNDSTAITVTLSGQQDGLPKVLKTGATLADDIAYLNALV